MGIGYDCLFITDASPRKRTDQSASFDEEPITDNYDSSPIEGVKRSSLSLELEGITTSSMNDQNSYSEGFDEDSDEDMIVKLTNVRDVKPAPGAKFEMKWPG